jgi:hypothetical protein
VAGYGSKAEALFLANLGPISATKRSFSLARSLLARRQNDEADQNISVGSFSDEDEARHERTLVRGKVVPLIVNFNCRMRARCFSPRMAFSLICGVII